MSNRCPTPNKHLCSLYHQWLVSRWEDEYDDQSFFKVKVYLTSLCSGCWGHPRCDDEFIFHRSEYITHNPLSQMTYQNLPLISYDPSLLMTITDDSSPVTITYTLWPMFYHYDLYLMTLIVTHHTWLWPITTHDFYLISPIHQEPSPMTYHPQLITHEYDFSPMTVIHDHHLWPWLITIIYDLSHLWISGLSPISTTYDHHDFWLSGLSLMTYLSNNHHLWLSLMTYDLWPMTYYVWPISPMIPTYHSWLSLTTTNHGLLQRSPMSYHHL